MKFQAIFVAIVLATSFNIAYSQDADAIRDCLNTFLDRIRSFINSGSTDTTAMCPALEDYIVCVFRAATSERPSQDVLDEIVQQIESNVQGQAVVSECNLDFDKMADEAWNGNMAVTAHPLPILATITVSLFALFVSAVKL